MLESPCAVPILFLIDNLMTRNVAARVHGSRAYPELAREIGVITAQLERMTQVYYEWVPGHVGWDINECADRMAKRGAAGITSLAPLTPRLTLDPATSNSGRDFRPPSLSSLPPAKRPRLPSPNRTRQEPRPPGPGPA